MVVFSTISPCRRRKIACTQVRTKPMAIPVSVNASGSRCVCQSITIRPIRRKPRMAKASDAKAIQVQANVEYEMRRCPAGIEGKGICAHDPQTKAPPPTPPPDIATKSSPCNPCIVLAAHPTQNRQIVVPADSMSARHAVRAAASRWTHAPAAARCTRSESCRTAVRERIRATRRRMARSRLKYTFQPTRLPSTNNLQLTTAFQKSTCILTDSTSTGPRSWL